VTKVLYIENNDDNVYMLKMRLELGRCARAASGHAAAAPLSSVMNSRRLIRSPRWQERAGSLEFPFRASLPS
jgi:hypothetical protein